MNDFDIWMIRIKGDELSEIYAKYCAKSWTDAGFKVNFFDAVTPDTLDERGGHINFHKSRCGGESSCFVSQYLLWKKCYEENRPILVLEHDAYLTNPEAIIYNPSLAMQYFGQHCMEAVLYNPWWARRMCTITETSENLRGPFGMVEHALGIPASGHSRYKLLSKYGIAHARFFGPKAPVKHVIIPELGTSSVRTNGHKTSDRLQSDHKDLFKIVPLSVALDV